MAKSLEDSYPNIARWLYEHEGLIEIGYNPDSPFTSFVRAVDQGGMLWDGENSYASLAEALADVDAGLEELLKEIYGS